MLPYPTLISTDLKVRLAKEGTEYVLEFNGRGETPEVCELLRTFLATIDQTVVTLGIQSLVVDFKALLFINSSCFKELVVWLSAIRGRPRVSQYQLVFRSNPELRWQRASLYSLSTFAIDLVQIS